MKHDTSHFFGNPLSTILWRMYKVKGSIWIESEKGPFIGLGRAMLLQKIKEFGSITEAAKAMKMSYRHAWEMVDEMNRHYKKPLLITSSGGIRGGGSMVTKEGDKALNTFWKLHKKFENFSQKETTVLEI